MSDALSVEEMSVGEWIKCSERMPDKGAEVLIAGTVIDYDTDPIADPSGKLYVSFYRWTGSVWEGPTGFFDEPLTLQPWYWMAAPPPPTR